MAKTVNPLVFIVVSVLLAILSVVAGYFKIIPDSLVQAIVASVISFLMSASISLDVKKLGEIRFTSFNRFVEEHLRNHK